MKETADINYDIVFDILFNHIWLVSKERGKVYVPQKAEGNILYAWSQGRLYKMFIPRLITGLKERRWRVKDPNA